LRNDFERRRATAADGPVRLAEEASPLSGTASTLVRAPLDDRMRSGVTLWLTVAQGDRMGQVGAVNGFKPPRFSVETRSGVSVRAVVSGEIDVTASDRFETAIRSALEERPDTLVVDLSATSFIDSTGVHALMAAHRLAESSGIQLVIIPAPGSVQRVFKVTGLEASLPFAFGRAARRMPGGGTTMGEQAAGDAERSASEADQTASDSNQTAADSDQASSESDQQSSEADQQASDRDEAASSRDSGGGAESASQHADREASSDERREATSDRQAATAARETTGSDRLATSSGRDEAAAARDHAAWARDRAADDRDRAAARADSPAIAARTQARVDRARAAADRRRAAGDREQAAADRGFAREALAQAQLDGLTGTYRREVGVVLLQGEVDRALRGDGRMVLAFVDIDGLKQVNDQGGHAAGDAVLVEIIHDNLRSYDLVVRFGGDEFVCALADSDLTEASRRFEGIRAALRESSGRPSVSVGLAALQSDDTLQQLLARGDSALYEDKRGN